MENSAVSQRKAKWRSILTEYFYITVGSIIVATGLYTFAVPNEFVLGGVTGISIILTPFLPSFITPAVFVLALNVILLLVGFIFLGKDFGFKTVYGSILYSLIGIVIERIEPLFPSGYPLTADASGEANLLLELLLAVVLPAVGSAIVFYYNGSGGGTDIIAMILKKYTHIESGKGLIIADFFIMLVSFANSIEIGLLSALGLFLKSLILDRVNRSMNLAKYCIIITTKPDEVREFISKKMNRGGTMWKGEGVYTGEEKAIFFVVMKAKLIKNFRSEIKNIDEHAFTVVDDTSDVIGSGFRALV